MLSESVDSTVIEPDDRSQPQISAIFPYLGTRFPKKAESNTERHARRRKARAPPEKTCRHRRARASHSKTSDHGNARSLIPEGTQASGKTQSSSIDTFAPKRAMRVRGSTRLKNDAPFIPQTRKWATAGTDAFTRHISCSTSPILEKSAMTAP